MSTAFSVYGYIFLFTKARIAKKFGLDMTGLTEKEAMKMNGYSRIYDCGKIKYELIPKSV